MNELQRQWNVTYTFYPSGSMRFENPMGDIFVVPVPTLPAGTRTTSLYFNSTYVVQNFKVGTILDLWVYYDFSKWNDRVKISFVGVADKECDVEWMFENPKGRVIRAEGYRYHIGDLGYDWTDLVDITEFEISDNKLKIKLDTSFNLDPTTIGSASVETATANAFQRKAFYANGRFWVFYADGTNIVFRTSVTGQTGNWSSATTVRSGVNGYRFSVDFNGSHVAYADGYGLGLSYRLGTTNSDGSITWATTEQTVTSGFAYHPSITFDANDYSWIVYRTPYTGQVNVTKNSVKNGSWITESGFPTQLSSGSTSANFRQVIVPLGSGAMYAIYASLAQINGTYWDGFSWDTSETITSTNTVQGGFSAVVDSSGNIHLAFLRATTYDIVYVKRTGSSWGSEIELVSSQGSSAYPSISKHSSDLYIFWCYNNYIRVIEYESGAWQLPKNWASETEYNAPTLTSAYTTDSTDMVAVVWTQGSSPFNVLFDAYPPPSMGEFQAPSRPDISEYFLLNVTINDRRGVDVFENATIELNGTVVLKWLNSTNTFSEYSDPNGYCTLDASGSFRSSVNSTAYKLSWKIKLNMVSSWDITTTNTKVYDSLGYSGSNSQSGLFVTDKLTVTFTSAPAGPQAGQSITLSWTITRQSDSSTVSSFTIDISKDDALWKSSLTISSTTDTEESQTIHTYDVYAITDNTYDLTSWDSTALTVSWSGTGGPGGVAPTPTPKPTPTPEVGPTPVPPMVTVPPSVNLITLGVVLIVAIIALSTLSGELGGKLKKTRGGWNSQRARSKKKRIKWEKPKPRKTRWSKKKAWE